jgi:hypothetical protein
MADAALGAKTGVPLHDGGHQLVGVEAALHQRLRLSLRDELYGLGGGRVAVRGLDELGAAEIELELIGNRGDLLLGADENRPDQPELRSLERAR